MVIPDSSSISLAYVCRLCYTIRDFTGWNNNSPNIIPEHYRDAVTLVVAQNDVTTTTDVKPIYSLPK